MQETEDVDAWPTISEAKVAIEWPGSDFRVHEYMLERKKELVSLTS